MSQNASAKIRTVALVGHGAAGKTTLAESLLAATGAITTRGSVEKGNTVCDFDPVEKDLGHSLQSALVSMDWAGTLIHVVDTPGYPDFAGQAIGALAAVDTALVVINAQTGIELATERMFNLAGERGLCRMIVINKIDADNVDLPALVADDPRTLRQAVPVARPAGAPWRGGGRTAGPRQTARAISNRWRPRTVR
jgi:elongation factor G